MADETILQVVLDYTRGWGLDEADLRTVAARLQQVTLEAGATLCREGDVGDAIYIVQDGRFGVTRSDAEGVVRYIERGETIGEVALLTGRGRSGTVTAAEPSRVLMMRRRDFYELLREEPHVMGVLTARLLPAVQEIYLRGLLRELLGNLSAEAIRELVDQFEWLALGQGEVLFEQGSAGDGLYLLVSGRLCSVVDRGMSSEKLLGEVEMGEVVGELSLLTDQPHMATVAALRESWVVHLNQQDFNALVAQHPAIMKTIARVVVERQQRNFEPPRAVPPRSRNIVLLPHSGVPVADLAEQLRADFQRFGSVMVLDSVRFDGMFGVDGAAQTEVASSLDAMLTRFLFDLETRHRFLLLIPDAEWTPWTQRCLKIADRLLICADPASDPAMTRLEEAACENAPSVRRELVLLHPAETKRPSGTARWLDARSVSAHHHLRVSDDRSFRRMVRRLTGNALGMVFSGGGARGMAHMGVLMGIEEQGLEIDVLGGTSMGALQAVAFAHFGNTTEMRQMSRMFGTRKALLDFTLPFVSLMTTRKVTDTVQTLFGGPDLEDYWVPVFCVATNITTNQPLIMQRGVAWEAVRMSISMPAIFAPVVKEGELIIDGGIINNFPGDILRDLHQPGYIIGSMTSGAHTRRAKQYDMDYAISGWQVLRNRLNPFAKTLKLPSLPGTILRTFATNSAYRAKEAAALVDLFIAPDIQEYGSLDYDQTQEIIERGYAAAQAALPQITYTAQTPRAAEPAPAMPDAALEVAPA